MPRGGRIAVVVMIIRAAWPSGDKKQFQAAFELAVVEHLWGGRRCCRPSDSSNALPIASEFFSASACWANSPDWVVLIWQGPVGFLGGDLLGDQRQQLRAAAR